MRKISFRVRNFENEQFLTFNIDNEAELDEELLDFVEDEEPAGIFLKKGKSLILFLIILQIRFI